MSIAKNSRVVTIKDVARAAGVSVGSVSKALNGAPGLKAVTRTKIQAAIEQLNYHPNAAARSMRTMSSKLIGCMISTIDNSIGGQMIQGAEAKLRESGYTILLAANSNNAENEASILQVFKERRADGIILTTNCDHSEQTKQRLKSLNIPIVLWERESGDDFDAALTNHADGVEVGVSHLVDLGHKRIALVAGYRETWLGREQQKGYQRALEAANIAFDETLVTNVEKFDFSFVHMLFQLPDPPTALIVNQNNAAETLRAIKAMKLEAPKDVSLISIGDSDELDVFDPPLTAIRGDGRTIGMMAAHLIVKRLEEGGAGPSRRFVIPMELIIRGSTGRPPK